MFSFINFNERTEATLLLLIKLIYSFNKIEFTDFPIP
jgi:hypothetical protein